MTCRLLGVGRFPPSPVHNGRASCCDPDLRLQKNPHNVEIRMNKNQIEGSVKDVTGKLQQKIGQATGNTNQRVKGVAKQIEG